MNIRSLLLGTAAVALMGSSALAADLYIPETPAPIVESANFGFEGLYAGVQIGGLWSEGLDSEEQPIEGTQAFIGGVVGYNFTADPLLLGIELQGNYYFEGDFVSAGEILALGKIGFVATENFAIYATGGVGYVWQDNDVDFSEYALGLGAEFLVTEDLSIRGDILGIATEGSDGFDGARASVGLLWHF